MSPVGGRRFKSALLNASSHSPVAKAEAQDQPTIHRL
jgi:hypothetical protein